MAGFILLMHSDGGETGPAAWEVYFTRLRAAGVFEGGSEIGSGACLRHRDFGPPGHPTSHIRGYIRVTASDIGAAFELVIGNPVYEAGGTVEVRELPRS